MPGLKESTRSSFTCYDPHHLRSCTEPQVDLARQIGPPLPSESLLPSVHCLQKYEVV